MHQYIMNIGLYGLFVTILYSLQTSWSPCSMISTEPHQYLLWSTTICIRF